MSEHTVDKNLQKFADLMIKKIKEVSDDWDKPWFNTVGHGLPQNVEGRIYGGMNSFMLYLLCDEMRYKTPVFMTFAQAVEKKVNILKGEKAFPIIYWNFSVKDDKGNKITFDEYKSLSKEEQKKYTVSPYAKYYLVFNIDQTNFAEVHPEKWKELQQQFKIAELKDDKGLFACPELDQLIEHNTWLCPIASKPIDRAFYRPSEDKIYIPLKGQFYTGERYYNTVLHEMTHSTGIESRLGREIRQKFGSPKYAKEELIAEFTAAVTCRSLGIVSGIQEHNAKYLKNWLEAITDEPKFIYSVLTDVGKASTMILDEVCRNRELTVSEPSQVVPAMTEEEYVASKGFPNDFGESALHKGKQGSQALQDKVVERQLEKDREYSLKRSELRQEYQEKLANGTMREPTSVEKLIKAANGMPELESVQAARRALEKRGVAWNKEETNQKPLENKNITSAFTTAIVAGLSGQYQALVDLKQNGYVPSKSDLQLLKEIAPSVRPAVESIFHIRIDPLQFTELKGTVTQLSLNF